MNNYYTMNIIVALYSAILFFLLSPNILLRLPPNGSKMTVTLFHSLVFALVIYFTQTAVWRWSTSLGM